MTISERLNLEVLGREKVAGIDWVVYSDGAYRHVVTASDYDAECTIPPADSDDDAEPYTDWCSSAEFADDDTARQVGAACDLTCVHSALDGLCSVIDCED